MPALDTHLNAAHACHLCEVVSVEDPEQFARVKVKLLTVDGDGQAEIWARVAVPFAGSNRGALLIPDVGDEVLVTFVAGDPRFPIVIGGLWNGGAQPPEQFSGNRVDRWSFTGKAGTRIAIEEISGQPVKIKLETPNGVRCTLSDDIGESIKLEDTSGNSITLSSSGITVTSSAKVTVNASTVAVSAGMVTVDAGMSKFSGVVQCDTLITNAVVSASYTPGAGNIW